MQYSLFYLFLFHHYDLNLKRGLKADAIEPENFEDNLLKDCIYIHSDESDQ